MVRTRERAYYRIEKENLELKEKIKSLEKLEKVEKKRYPN